MNQVKMINVLFESCFGFEGLRESDIQPMKFTIFYVGKQLPTWIGLCGSHVSNIEYHVGKYFFKSN